MSETVVEIVGDGGYRAAEPYEVLIVEGDTVEFSSQVGAGTILSLTPETAGVLSPKPATLQVEIAAGASITFTFLKPASLPYCCQVLAEGVQAAPFTCPPPGDDPILTILASEGRGPGDKTGRGL
jgi:hypothetical protein